MRMAVSGATHSRKNAAYRALGAVLPRKSPVAMSVGRGYLAQNGEVALVQTAMPR